MMRWRDIDRMAAQVPLAAGYRFELLRREEIGLLIGALQAWYPDISVGAASCFLRRDFFEEQVCFAGEPERDVIVFLMKRGDELAGMFSCDRDRDSLTLYARLGVASPDHRGANLAEAGIALTEQMGRRMGAGYLYGLATLKTRYVQRAFERSGWQLVGITPGFDRELVAPGVVKRVYEAVYSKVLVADAALLHPQPQNLTPRTRSLFEGLFS
ncbi:MAG TPA: hypothetical protein VF169_08315 [Albitalea sp.]|uniref:hypothetical protein n=1 Tax=Piscinibacter sp. TaxID=1903157 RepID=UPI002ED2AACC